VFFAVLRQYVEYCNNAAVLYHLIGAFDPALVSKHAMSITTLIRDSEVQSRCYWESLYSELGRCLVAEQFLNQEFSIAL